MHPTQKLPVNRKDRTCKFRKQVEQEWKAYYLEFIKTYMFKPLFNWHNLSSNLNIDPQYIFDNPQLPWDISRVICRLDIPIETIIERYKDKPSLWTVLMYREDITMEYIEAHPEYPWTYSDIHNLNHLSIDFIKKYADDIELWNCLQFNKSYTIKDYIAAFPDHIYEDDIKYILGMPSEQVMLVDDAILTAMTNAKTCTNICEIVEAHPMIPWQWSVISYNPTLTPKFLRKYKHKLTWRTVTSRIDKRVIKSCPELPWDFRLYCYRDDITRSELFEHIMDYTDTDNFRFGAHPQIRFCDFRNVNIIKWNINSVSYNKFEFEKAEFIIRKYKEYLAAYRIQQYYNLVATAPVYSMCRKRISMDYEREFCKSDDPDS